MSTKVKKFNCTYNHFPTKMKYSNVNLTKHIATLIVKTTKW